MAYSRQSSWLGTYIPVFVFLLLATLHSSYSANNDYYVDVVRESPSTLSDSTLRHIMQLVTLDPEDTFSPDWIPAQTDKRLSEFLGGPGKRVSEFLGGPGKRVSEFLGGPGKRVSEFLGGPGKRISEFLGGPGKRLSEFLGGPGKRHGTGNFMHGTFPKRVSEFLGGPGKRPDYDFQENSDRR